MKRAIITKDRASVQVFLDGDYKLFRNVDDGRGKVYYFDSYSDFESYFDERRLLYGHTYEWIYEDMLHVENRAFVMDYDCYTIEDVEIYQNIAFVLESGDYWVYWHGSKTCFVKAVIT